MTEITKQSLQDLTKKIRTTLEEKKELSLGIDQGTGALRYVLTNKETKKIVKWGSFEFGAAPEGQQEKQSSGKKGPDKTSQFLKSLAKSLPKKKLQSIFINLRDPSTVVGNLEFSLEEGENEQELIQTALRGELPYPVEDASYICKDLDERPTEIEAAEKTEKKKTQKKHYHFTSVSRKAIPHLVRSVEDQFKITPAIISDGYINERLAEFMDLSKFGEAVAFINIGRSTTTISVIQDKKLAYERNIPLAGQDLTRAIFISYTKGLSARSTRDLETSETIKKQSFIPVPGQKVSPELEEENQKVYEVIQGILNAWVNDIRLSLQYFDEKTHGSKITHIYVTGGGANLKNTTDFLSHQLKGELDAEIKLLTFPEDGSFSLEEGASVDDFKKQFHEYSNALALALMHDNYANLVPAQFYAGRLERIAEAGLRIAPIFVGACFLLWIFFLNAESRYMMETKKVLEQQSASLAKIEKPYLEMMQWEKFLRGADARTLAASHILKVVSRRIPPNLIFSRFYLDRDQAIVLMEGVVYGDPKKRAITMAEFSKTLTNSPYFREAEVSLLQSIGSTDQAGRFRISAQLMKLQEGAS